ncbi:MAG: site-specific DNA-methyltransferase [Sphingobium sp.]
MDKLKMHSPDINQDNIAKIRALFPDCVTEAADDQGAVRLAVDFDQLRQILSDHIVEGPQERYRLDWPGKREALLTANAPIAKTLRPCRDESVDFDTTQNLFIEGDNLDALKLLQESYLGEIKLIYIDPPYNRKKGNDLVYRDDFFGNSFDYLTASGQADEDDRRLVANTEANGRFHSDWLGMMLSRLRLCKNVMSKSGVVLISIDDNELHNVLKICHEIFGENNFVGSITWKNVTDNNPTNVAIEHEYIVVFAKSKTDLERIWKSNLSDIKDVLIEVGSDLNSRYQGDELQAAYQTWFREHKSQLGPLDRYKYVDEGGVYTGSQSVHNPGKEGYRYDVLHPETGKPCKEPLMGYRFPWETMQKLIRDEKILYGEDHHKIIELKVYAHEFLDKLSSVYELDGRTGPYDLRSVFPEGAKIFSNPKPVVLMERLVSFCTSSDDFILDLFAGSGTLSEAVLRLNSLEGSSRKIISVQYPEEIDISNSDGKAAAKLCEKVGLAPVVSEISKERIRRAGRRVLEGTPHEGWNRDVGFRVLKIDSSNMTDVYYRPDEVKQDELFGQVDSVKPDRSAEDLLFQVLIDWGVELTLPINRQTLHGKTVYSVDGDAVIACFEPGVTDDLVKDIAARAPLRAVFRDTSFARDADRINAEQLFRQLSPGTELKAI